MQYHAFLSYSHTDIEIMRQVRDDLINAGLNIWTDENLTPGTQSWKNAIEDAIENAGALVVLLSPDAKHSDWIEKEIDYARACDLSIVPILIRGQDEISAVPFELINVQRIDLRADYASGIQRLIQTIGEDNISASVPHHSYQIPLEKPSVDELNPYSVYDHVRLFIWLFWMPDKLRAYLDEHDEKTFLETTAWMVGDLSWIPFFAPAIGIVLGTVHITVDDAALSIALQAVSGTLFLAGWFATGWLGWRDQREYTMGLLVVVALVTFGLFTLIFNLTGFVLSEGGGYTRPVFLILTGILLSSATGIAFRLTTVAAGAIAGLLLGSLLFNALAGVQLGIDGGIAAFVMFVQTFLVAHVVDISITRGERTLWHVLSFAVILGAGLLMIWFYFLGGWLFLCGQCALSS